eukprot:COSAG01_NODE_28971_length_648_cov_1.032787_1_plen_81_part_10
MAAGLALELASVALGALVADPSLADDGTADGVKVESQLKREEAREWRRAVRQVSAGLLVGGRLEALLVEPSVVARGWASSR